METFIGTIMMFAGNYAPEGWLFCHGQLLPITQYQALYAILGTMYGGDGRTNFALPDLRGRVPVGFGQGQGLDYNVNIGQWAGNSKINLNVNNLPPHNHTINANNSIIGRDSKNIPGGNFPGKNQDDSGNYTTSADVVMNASVVGYTGEGQGVDVKQPCIGINFIIAIQGEFPPRA